MMLTSVVIVGVGGLGRKCHEILEDINAVSLQFDFKGFIDGDAALTGSIVHGYSVLGTIEWCFQNPAIGVIVAVGNPSARKRLVGTLVDGGVTKFPQLIHPMASISPRCFVDKGAIIAQYAIIQANARVGAFASVGSFSVFGHDTSIGDFVSSGPHICVVGSGEVGEGGNIGTGAVILANAPVGKWTTIGANATVTRPIPDGATAVGSPARVIRIHPEI